MATPWSVPKNLKGKTLAILASGPSMTRDISRVLLQAKVHAIAINSISLEIAPWTEMVYAADTAWWSRYYVQLAADRIKITCNDSVTFPKVNLLKQTGTYGFDQNPANIRTGRNSGYQAVHIGLHTGASRILLCGMDMTTKHGVHCHGFHPHGLGNPSESFLQECLGHWQDLTFPAEEQNCSIINCSSISKITCFPKMTVEEALCL